MSALPAREAPASILTAQAVLGDKILLMAIGLSAVAAIGMGLSMIDATLAIGMSLALLALAVAVRNITPDSWSRIRVLLYLAFSAVLAVFGVYGFVNTEAIATWLSTLDAVLNVGGIILLGVASAKVPLVEDPLPELN